MSYSEAKIIYFQEPPEDGDDAGRDGEGEDTDDWDEGEWDELGHA